MRKMNQIFRIFLLALSLPSAAAAASGATLDQVQKRGYLICGANPGVAGFGLPDDKGDWTGFDIDFCRAIAAAIFNDKTKVKFVPLTGKDRFTALQSGEVDVLSRNTTWTLSRETGQGFLFAGITYYDVPADYHVTGYRYTYVNDHAVLVDTRTHQIVQIID